VNNGIFVQDIYTKPGFEEKLPKAMFNNPLPVGMPYHFPNSNWSVNLQQDAVFVYDTRNENNTTVTVPIAAGNAYNVTIDWGNGDIKNYSGTAPISYTYNNHGIYIVRIIGKLSVLSNGNLFTNPNRNKLIKCLSVGILSNLSFLFGNGSNIGYPNLIEAPNDIPSSVNNISYAFAGCTIFNDPNIRSWNVGNVTNMQSVFNGASLFNQPLGNWNVSNVTDMGYMFQSTQFNQPINSWDVSKVVSFRGMFNGSSFNQDISEWNIINATDIAAMFSFSPFDQNIGNWNTAKVVDTSTMFFFNRAFNQPLNNWNVRKVTNFANMFDGAIALNSSLSGWALGADTVGTSCLGMFQNARYNQPLSSWDTSKVTNMGNMFAQQMTVTGFNQDIGAWNTSSVTNMSLMFYNNYFFNNGGSSSINNWNTSNVIDMNSMFYQAGAFNQPIGNWNVSKVRNMSSMFYRTNLFNQNISGWNLAGLNANTSLDNFMLDKTGVNAISTTNYDALLIGWNNNKLIDANGIANWRTDLRPHFGGARYTAGGAAAAARAALVSYGWTITDGGVA